MIASGSGSNPRNPIRDEVLASAGFTSTNIHASGSSRFIVARQTFEVDSAVRKVLIVIPEGPSEGLSRTVDQVEHDLVAHNYDVVRVFFGDIPEQASPYLVLAALDVDTSILEDLDETSFTNLRSLFLGSFGTLWLTEDSGSRGLVKGLGRTIRAEHPEISFVTLGLDSTSPLNAEINIKTITRVLDKISKKTLGDVTDSEYVLRGGNVLVERLVPHHDLKALLDSSRSGIRLPAVKISLEQVKKPLQLSIRDSGLLNTLEYIPIQGLSDSPSDGEIEIQVGSVGLNFRDVMVAMGQMEDSTLGIECAGVVSRIGRGVEKFRVGDRVFGMHAGCFQTRVRVDPRTFQKTPEHLGNEEAASLMCTYATVVHALIDVGRLQRGESVLIHSAAGGVGQAAIRLSQFLGAEIFATVSSEKKKRFLVNEYGIKESHIFNSRDYSFADGILRLTAQKGVDIVLNSLAQEALRRTWHCVAPFGRFIELGKRDIYDNSGLEMRPFLNNITFAGLDILTQVIDYPERFEKIGAQVAELLQKGAIAPLNNLIRYSFGEAEEAFRLMQSGGHIGKIVLSLHPHDIVPVSFMLKSCLTQIFVE